MKRFISIPVCAMLLLTVINTQGQSIFDAFKNNEYAKVKLLVDADLKLVDARDQDSLTPLHWAARGASIDILKYLLDKGADVNAKDVNGSVPLHSTSSRNNFEASKLLIEHGSVIDFKNVSGATPFYYAAQGGDGQFLEYLLSKGANISDLEIKNAYGRTPLCAVSRDGGNVETVKTLIGLGADINTEDYSGWTPIMLASWRPYKEVVDVLLDAGADLQVGTENGEQLLVDAVSSGLEKLFAELVNKNTSLTILNEYGGTLLHSAAEGGSSGIVESLISLGFDVNKADRYGWSPIHIATEQGHNGIISFLITKGAYINVRNKLGETPYNIAEDRHDTLLINYFKSLGADTSAPKFPEITGKYLGRPLPGLIPERFAPGIVSQRYEPHSTVAISPNGDEIFWNPMIKSRGGGYSYGYIMTTRLENGVWTHPEKAFFSEKEFRDDHPFFSPDGKKLYFRSNRPGSTDSHKLWYINKTENGWVEPQLMDVLPVPSGPSELVFTFSFDEKGNFYCGNGDIWHSQLLNGEYTELKKMGDDINTNELEGSPLVSPKGDYLIFNRGSLGNNMQMLVCFKNIDNTWAPPVKINDQIRDMNYTISGDYLMLGGHRWVSAKIIEDLRPAQAKGVIPKTKFPF
jgi:ankyrin repeat protein